MSNISNLKYNFDKAKYKTGKIVASTGFSSAAFVMFFGSLAGEIIVTSSSDDIVGNNNEQVVESLKQMEAKAVSKTATSKFQKEYISELLTAEDLSEEQVRDALKNFKELTKTSPSEILGVELGNIGDLRECRIEVGNDNIKDIAACTVDKSVDDKIFSATNTLVTVAFWMLFVFGGVDKARKWAKYKPQNPLYKH